MYVFQLIRQNQCRFSEGFQTKKVQIAVLAVQKLQAAMPLDCDMAAYRINYILKRQVLSI
jgi:hypothetical protein